MKEEKVYNTLDNQIEFTNFYRSQCIQCAHLGEDMESCPAFPQGIPQHLLFEMGKHDHILPEQVGEIIFQKQV